jgi:hypothetical protein
MTMKNPMISPPGAGGNLSDIHCVLADDGSGGHQGGHGHAYVDIT